VRADGLEGRVLFSLMRMFKEPWAMIEAVRGATPDQGKALDQKKKLDDDLERVRRGRDDVLALVAAGAVTLAQAEKRLLALKGREESLQDQLGRLAESLEEEPWDPTPLERFLWSGGRGWEECRKLLPPDYNEADDFALRERLFDRAMLDNQRLIQAVFGEPLAGGEPAGVYVSPAGEAKKFQSREYTFVLRGRLQFAEVLQTAEEPEKPAVLPSGVPCLGRRRGTGRAGSAGR
jgi:hypothetical protein